MLRISVKPRQSNWVAALGILLGVVLTIMGLSWPAQAAAIAPPLTPTLARQDSPPATSDAAPISNPRHFVATAINQVGPAVVRIDTERMIVRTVPDPFGGDPFFRHFFGEEGLSPFPGEGRLRGLGSGFIIDRSGIVLTNAHVVSGADTVTVTLKDGRSFEGEVRGADEVSDLAVVKIKGAKGDLPVAPLGESDQLQVGDWAIAVGNPVGLDNTVTLGIISTLHRSSAQVGIPDKRLDFIQTDAAINPGNSGGPLLNDRGEVIGINTAIRAGASGIGFAIPVDKAKSLKDRLARGEKIDHPYLGVQMAALTPQVARDNNRNPNSPIKLPEINGVLVVRVLANTPAAAAGLRLGDVIVEAEGQPLTDAGQLQNIVENSRVGQELQLKVKRGDQTQRVAVRSVELPSAA